MVQNKINQTLQFKINSHNCREHEYSVSRDVKSSTFSAPIKILCV